MKKKNSKTYQTESTPESYLLKGVLFSVSFEVGRVVLQYAKTGEGLRKQLEREETALYAKIGSAVLGRQDVLWVWEVEVCIRVVGGELFRNFQKDPKC